jgi:general L-amino acid transport system permease protein
MWLEAISDGDDDACSAEARRWSWRSRAARGVVYQVLALADRWRRRSGSWHNTLQNMRVRGIQSGFDFLGQPAGFDIGESMVPTTRRTATPRPTLVGLSNTLRVALVGIVLATVLGTLVGVGRLLAQRLVRGLCYATSKFRNVPVLLQLLMWYLVLTEALPAIRGRAAPLAGLFFFSKNGLQYPVPVWAPGHWGTVIGAAAGAGGGLGLRPLGPRPFRGHRPSAAGGVAGLVLLVAGAARSAGAGGSPTDWNVPREAG